MIHLLITVYTQNITSDTHLSCAVTTTSSTSTTTASTTVAAITSNINLINTTIIQSGILTTSLRLVTEISSIKYESNTTVSNITSTTFENLSNSRESTSPMQRTTNLQDTSTKPSKWFRYNYSDHHIESWFDPTTVIIIVSVCTLPVLAFLLCCGRSITMRIKEKLSNQKVKVESVYELKEMPKVFIEGGAENTTNNESLSSDGLRQGSPMNPEMIVNSTQSGRISRSQGSVRMSRLQDRQSRCHSPDGDNKSSPIPNVSPETERSMTPFPVYIP